MSRHTFGPALALVAVLTLMTTAATSRPASRAPVAQAATARQPLNPATASLGDRADGSGRVVLAATADTWVGLSEDAYFDIRSPEEVEAPRGSETQLVTGRHGEYRGATVAFVAFERPDPEVASLIESAKLEMYAQQTFGGPLPAWVPATEVFEVLEPWDEQTLDAFSAPRLGFIDRFVQPLDQAFALPGQWAAWDVTGPVKRAALADQWYGFWLITGEKQWVTSFGSRESPTPPRLVLELGVEPASTLYVPVASGGSMPGLLRPTPLAVPPTTQPNLPPHDAPGVPRLLVEPSSADLEFGGVPELEVEWHNDTDETVPVILPVDAATYAWRMPMYVWQVTGPDGGPPRTRFAGRCSCFDPLVPDDFAELLPGSRRAAVGAGKAGELPGPQNHFSFVEPGRYEVRLIYFLDKLGGVPPPGVADLWADARDMTVVSRLVSVTVGPPAGAYASRLERSRLVELGVPRAEVESVMGHADQAIDEAFAPYRTYLVYYLADPRDGEPSRLPSPQADLSGGHYWRPRFVVMLGGQGEKVVQETVLLP